MFKIGIFYIVTFRSGGFTRKDCDRQSFFHLRWYTKGTLKRSSGDEADVSAKQPEAEEQTWFPGENGFEGRQEGPLPPQEKGTLEADRQR